MIPVGRLIHEGKYDLSLVYMINASGPPRPREPNQVEGDTKKRKHQNQDTTPHYIEKA